MLNSLTNRHSEMVVSIFNPDFTKTLAEQKFPGNEVKLNGAGIMTILTVKNSNEQLILTLGKLNPETNNFENSLALGGGFKFLPGGIEGNTFAPAINASINFKAPAYPSFDQGTIAPTALVGFCAKWGNMQYATLHRFIEVDTTEDAVKLVSAINQKNIELGKPDRLALVSLTEAIMSAQLTSLLPENNKTKGDAIEHAGLVVTDLVSDEQHARFVIFDDLAADALNKLIFSTAKLAEKVTSADVRAVSRLGALPVPREDRTVVDSASVVNTPAFSN